MPRNWFNHLFKALHFSRQLHQKPQGMSHERYRWMLVDDFVHNFNKHRAKNFEPGQRICVDESISRWYGQGGEWITIGVPHYVAINCKPESGCKIQNAACAESGIMIRLKLVKSKREENSIEDEQNNDEDDGINHGTKVLMDLVAPWTFTDRIICADSYFASKQSADMLMKFGLRFIGVVKTATKGYPMKYLSKIELAEQGDHYGLVSYDNNSNSPNSLAFVWMDRERRYFISSCSSLLPGNPWSRVRWRQLDEDMNDKAERVELIIPQTKCSEIYYDTCAAIDQHNRCRQETLDLEKRYNAEPGISG